MSSRRPAKRSILGHRVAAIRDPSTGFYEQATVLEVASPGSVSPGEYQLKFDDDGHTCWYNESQIVGPGFQNISSTLLHVGQHVYCTVGHRESVGRIVQHTGSDGFYMITLEDGSLTKRKLDDLRLIKSRKSARITADKDKDYHSLALGKVDLYADMDTTYLPLQQAQPLLVSNAFSSNRKQRATMPPVDLPVSRHHLLTNSSYSPEELRYSPETESQSDGSSTSSSIDADEQELQENSAGDVLMDECSAALVLMSLGASPHNKQLFDFHDDAGFYSTSNSSVYASSWPSSRGMDNQKNLIRDSTTSSDEGIEMKQDPCMLDHEYSSSWKPHGNPVEERPQKRPMLHSIVFQCTWPQCSTIETTRTAIKRHIQNTHFTSAGQSAEELEFYYNELQVDGGLEVPSPSTPLTEKSIAAAAASVSASSPPLSGRSSYLSARNHQYQPVVEQRSRRHRSSHSLSSEASNNSRLSRFSSIAKPINIPRGGKRRDWTESASAPQADAMSVSSSTGSANNKLQQLQREVKKCRKVYGMENRDMWCTQCKWKKACTRFAEQS